VKTRISKKWDCCDFNRPRSHYFITVYAACTKGSVMKLLMIITSPRKSTGGAVPALAQLASSSYHAAVSSPSLPPPSQDEKMHKSRTSSTL
jgi:hypothetical protein